jgi:hypothetical protein
MNKGPGSPFMLSVLSCLREQHDLRLVLIAAVICSRRS